MEEQKFVEIAMGLTQSIREGVLKSEVAAPAGFGQAFKTVLGANTIQVEKGSMDIIKMVIKNQDGHYVGEWSWGRSNVQSFEIVEGLFNEMRRKALNADEVIDGILKQLGLDT